MEIAGAVILALWVSAAGMLPLLSLLPHLGWLNVFAGPRAGWIFLGWASVLLVVLGLRRRLFPTLLAKGPSS